MNKRGFIQDVALWAIVAFVFGIMIFIGAKLNTSFTDNYQASDASTTAKDIQKTGADRYYGIWNSAFLFVIVMFGIAVIVVLYYLSSTPALFMVALVLLGILAIPIAILGNAFDVFATNDDIAPESTNMPVVGFLMGHILEIGITFGFLGMILLFSRSGGGY